MDVNMALEPATCSSAIHRPQLVILIPSFDAMILQHQQQQQQTLGSSSSKRRDCCPCERDCEMPADQAREKRSRTAAPCKRRPTIRDVFEGEHGRLFVVTEDHGVEEFVG
jgi:hypothetical protein